MRICLVNYRYFVSGGPERYMFAVKGLLEERGHEVVPFSVRYSRNQPSPWEEYFVPPIAGDDEIVFRQHSWSPSSVRRALERAFFSREVYDALSRQLQDTKPDVAYVLHYLRKLSPAVLAALHDHGVPIVVRFSDFAMVCPQAHLVRNDRICELCLGGRLWPSVRYRCVQGSLPASVVNALAMTWMRRKGFLKLVDTFVAPSEILLQKMSEGGLPADRMVHLPTFVTAQPVRPFAERQRRICYVGRLERTKGVDVLVAAFALLRERGVADDVELIIAGDTATPMGREISARLGRRPVPGVTLAGRLDEAAVVDLIQSSLVSVVPSLWYENMPNALLESLACGTPVIASDLGSMHDILHGTGAGFLYPPGDQTALADALQAALADPDLESMGQVAQGLARGRYGPADHVDSLIAILERAQARSRPSASC